MHEELIKQFWEKKSWCNHKSNHDYKDLDCEIDYKSITCNHNLSWLMITHDSLFFCNRLQMIAISDCDYPIPAGQEWCKIKGKDSTK